MSEPSVVDLQKQIEELKAQLADHEADRAALDSGETPRYELIEPFYVDDQLWPIGAVLDYDGWPNEQMSPLNDSAKAKMKIILAGIDKRPRDEQIKQAAEALHARDRAAAEPLAGALADALSRLIRPGDSGALVMPGTHQMADTSMDRPPPAPKVYADPEMPKADKSVPIRGDLVLQGQRKRGRPRKVLKAVLPVEDGRPKGPERVMGTVVTQHSGAIVTGQN